MKILDMEKLINCNTCFLPDQLLAINNCSVEITNAEWDRVFEGFSAWKKSIMLNAPSVRDLAPEEVSPSHYLHEYMQHKEGA